MKKNMGLIDRAIRTAVAILILALYATEVIVGTVGMIMVALSVVFLLTSLIGSCPLYLPFGLTTLRRKKHV